MDDVGEVFRRPAFRALFIGQAISGFGDWMVTVALMALVLRLSGSSTAVGGVLLLRLLPAAAAAPFAARGVRGWDRRRTMQAADLVRAGIVIAIPLVAHLWWVYVCAFLLEAAGIVFLPARDSLIPDLVERDQLSIAQLGDPRVVVRNDPVRCRGLRRGSRCCHRRAAGWAGTRTCSSSSSTRSPSSCRSCSFRDFRNRSKRSLPRVKSSQHGSVMHCGSHSCAW